MVELTGALLLVPAFGVAATGTYVATIAVPPASPLDEARRNPAMEPASCGTAALLWHGKSLWCNPITP